MDSSMPLQFDAKNGIQFSIICVSIITLHFISVFFGNHFPPIRIFSLAKEKVLINLNIIGTALMLSFFSFFLTKYAIGRLDLRGFRKSMMKKKAKGIQLRNAIVGKASD
ncbi:unnamed protein product [Hymenolepis diminuta]|uniref:Uncharacterized protein n=1 Tax=Hymenolepis diminuta TaxID=6216 RepID=A0A564Y6Y4_HYMDI|nr:unnamed protein product [Hymenolepis diminuta]VUZ43042.1 unnamed protein product [Hymenolepis diminuta]